MQHNLFNRKLRFEGMKGVGTMELDFQPNQRVYTLIGENGVGKTKLLECWFSLLFLTYFHIIKKDSWIKPKLLNFRKVVVDSNQFPTKEEIDSNWVGVNKNNRFLSKNKHDFPVIYLSALNRGGIFQNNNSISQIGSKEKREKQYTDKIFNIFKSEYNKNELKTLNMDLHIEEWIIQRAQSANPYQAKEDNREVEIKTLLSLLNKIDQRIDADFLEISGSNRVFIKIEDQKRELSELSSGFSSILKILQSIIAGYSYFTNETQIANVRGIVLIDEIESHLHNQWQVKIIPLLKLLFPNTIFYITTHSSLVISQLNNGEAYRLQREQDGVVYSKPIKNPSRVTFVDLLQEAFDINLNQLKIQRAMQDDQSDAKKALLVLLDSELEKMEEK